MNWDHNYNIFLKEQKDSSVNLYDGRLGVYQFPKNTDETFPKSVSLKATLTKDSTNTYTLTFDSGLTYHF